MDITAPNKYFSFDKFQVFFKHTDFDGYLHPYLILEWTSYVREAFFTTKCADFNSILESHIKMMTAKIESNMLNDARFGDEIEARFTVTKIKKVSFDVIIRFFNKTRNNVTGETTHRLVFFDEKVGSFAPIPTQIKEAILEYQENE